MFSFNVCQITHHSSDRHVGSAMFTATFNLVTCQTIYRNFWNNESRLIHNLASFNCFTYRNLFQNVTNDMSKWLTWQATFCQKVPDLVLFGSSDFVQISPPYGINVYQ